MNTISNRNLLFSQALAQDGPAVLALYRSVLGEPFSTWSEEYPTQQEIEYDLAHGGLYVCRSGESIIGALSIVHENEFDGLELWKYKNVPAAELSRVVTAQEYRGRGIARFMVLQAEELLAQRGIAVVHLLAAKKNIPACRTYAGIGYETVGEYYDWDIDFWACEKLIGAE